jgi:hypothetical protein
MHRKYWSRLGQVIVACMLMAIVTPASAGGGGGFSGDSGDSSMNPFTGDSYAYFNCGHNLGEEGMIVPGRPNPQSPEEKARRAANPPPRNHTCVPGQNASPPAKSSHGEPGNARPQ